MLLSSSRKKWISSTNQLVNRVRQCLSVSRLRPMQLKTKKIVPASHPGPVLLCLGLIARHRFSISPACIIRKTIIVILIINRNHPPCSTRASSVKCPVSRRHCQCTTISKRWPHSNSNSSNNSNGPLLWSWIDRTTLIVDITSQGAFTVFILLQLIISYLHFYPASSTLKSSYTDFACSLQLPFTLLFAAPF